MYIAHKLANFYPVILFKTPGTPTVAFLQWNTRRFRKTLSNWVWKRDVLNIKPFGRPFFGCLPWCAGQICGISDAPYFGSAHFKYSPLVVTRDKT